MTKDELALLLARAMYKDRQSLESLKAYHYLKSYLLALEMDDLVGIATQYGIKIHPIRSI